MKQNSHSVIGLYVVVFVVVAIVSVALWTYRTPLLETLVISKLKQIQFGTIVLIHQDKSKTVITGSLVELPIATITIHDDATFYKALIKEGDVGLGDTYAQGTVWTCDSLHNLITILVENLHILEPNPTTYKSNLASSDDDAKEIQHHYDVGNDFYESFLKDPLMCYTCAFFFRPTDTLATAQMNKVHTIMRKLQLKPGERVLDIGCGWGRIAEYIQKSTNTTVVGLTISKEQISYIESRGNQAVYCHYMDMNPKRLGGDLFDKVYSIGMFEHVRCRNYKLFFERVSGVLREKGRLVLHTITTGLNKAKCSTGSTKTFTNAYIFPGGQIPKIEWTLDAAYAAGFKLVHLETFGGQHYARTLREWNNNLKQAYPDLLAKGYTMQKLRAYDYYMTECEVGFLRNNLQVTHFVFDKVQSLSDIQQDVFET